MQNNQTQGRVIYNVPLYSQGWSKLCWAYCQVMVECHQKGASLSRIQAKQRAQQLSNEKNGANAGGSPTNSGRRISISNIQQLHDALAQHGPVYAEYARKNSSKAGHMVVVTGVDVEKDEVYTNNPDSFFGLGGKGKQTFSEFQNSCYTKWFYGLFCRLYFCELVAANKKD